LTETVEAGAVVRRFRQILDEAEAFVQAMPAGREGLAYLRDGEPVEPDPGKLDAFETVAGSRRGH
jgi:hypothetical protein